ncbi:hypothetical protein QJQ45_013808 [Haematococcus lacustris]|nr:hypothetical protein QJQ45_013808 [Haematococcus lacustris]
MAAVLLLLATCLGWLNVSEAVQKHHLYREPIVNATLQREMEACGDFGPGAWISRKMKTLRLPEGARALWGTLYTQRRIWELQHPYDCRTAKLAFYSLPADGHGIGSSLHLLGHALGISMDMGRVFVIGQEVSVWMRGKHCKGSRTLDECYFQPVSSCNYDDVLRHGQALPYRRSDHTNLRANVSDAPVIQITQWAEMGDSHNVSNALTADIKQMLRQSPIPQEWWFYWWRCQAAGYMVRPNPRTLAAIDRARQQYFSQADRLSLESASWVSVYVRRGDKARENPEMLKDPKPFLDRATQLIRDNPGTVAPRIFLATEDVGVHSYFKANATVPVFSANVTRFNEDKAGYSPMDHAKRIGPDVEFINALMSLEFTMIGDAFVFAMVFLVPPKASNDRIAVMAGPRVNVRAGKGVQLSVASRAEALAGSTAANSDSRTVAQEPESAAKGSS